MHSTHGLELYFFFSAAKGDYGMELNGFQSFIFISYKRVDNSGLCKGIKSSQVYFRHHHPTPRPLAFKPVLRMSTSASFCLRPEECVRQ